MSLEKYKPFKLSFIFFDEVSDAIRTASYFIEDLLNENKDVIFPLKYNRLSFTIICYHYDFSDNVKSAHKKRHSRFKYTQFQTGISYVDLGICVPLSVNIIKNNSPAENIKYIAQVLIENLYIDKESLNKHFSAVFELVKSKLNTI